MHTDINNNSTPAPVVNPPVDETSAPKKAVTSKGKKVLIAEDEKPLARALQLKLTSQGYEAEIATNGQEALDILEKDPKSLLILDLVMPILDGFGVLTALKERGSKTPVIVLSNLSQEEDIQKVMSLGAAKFYIKSNTSLADLVEHIKELIG